MAKKVLVAMSGGVDSSVAALLLLEQGYDVAGATLKLFSNEDIGICDRTRTCCSLADVEDAKSVAERLGFLHYVFNFGDHFQSEVITRFAESYARGETPNPCIDCNRFIKFKKMLDRAVLLEFDYIATGHYARVEYDENCGRYLLKKAKDSSKDQSYVLYAMTQDELSKTLFPLGGLSKGEVREIAEKHDLVNAKKPDSQDICFVKDGDYAAFLENVCNIKAVPGNFVDKDNNVLGMHKGIFHYTIGQRKGINMSFAGPKYIVKKDTQNNAVTIGDESELYSDTLVADDINLISVEKLTEPMQVTVKTRYHQKEAGATIYPYEGNKVKVVFKNPQRAITAGQAAVFYDGDTVVGGGTIQ